MTKEKAPVSGAGGERVNPTPTPALLPDEIRAFCETLWPPHFELPAPARLVLWTAPSKLTTWVTPQNGLCAEALAAAQRQENTYLAIAAQDMQAALEAAKKAAREKSKPFPGPEYVRGVAETAVALAALPMDLDVRGEEHAAQDLPATVDEALAFVDALPLAPTVVTVTGHGVQGHWCFREPLLIETEDDRAAAESLLARWNALLSSLAARHGWKVDATHDLPRVMRIPGTLNVKGSVPVLARIHACNPERRYNLTDFEIYLPEETPGGRKRSGPPPARSSHALVPYGPIRDGCGWIRHCEADAVALPEPQWYAALGIWGRCVDGLTLAHEHSTPYPRYSERETDAKLAHALADAGPVTCARVSAATGGRWCKGCPSWGRIKSPVNLATPLNGPGKRPRLGGKTLGKTAAPPPAPEPPGPAHTPAGKGSAPLALSTFAKSDTGNAERLVAMFGGDIRWCPAMGWLTWDGERWQRDETRQVMDMAKRVIRAVYGEAAVVADAAERMALAKHAMKSESRGARESMVELAKSEPGIPVRLPRFDADPWLFNVENGTVDLRTGRLRPHRRADLITKLAPVVYAENATAPRWLSFLEEVLPDPEVRAFMQRFTGYALTGVVREHALPILWGSGANGKSTFLEAIKHAMGDYCVTANPTLLMAKSNENHPTERATLLNRRLALCMESEQDRTLAEVMVKALTGGDSISARFMRQDEFNFSPTHKLTLCTNHKPKVRGTDNGVWRRIMLVPFTVVVDEGKRDPALPEKLRAEAPGILAWAVAGCLEWQRGGLQPPAAVRAATDAYRQAEDTMAGFLAERCFVPEGRAVASQFRVKAGDLYGAFQDWCKDNGTGAMGQRSFGAALTERGFEREHGRNGWWYSGLRLLTKEELGDADPELETVQL